MATRTELPKDLVERAFDKEIASIKRSINTQHNAIIKDALNKELLAYEQAKRTLSEIK